MPTLLNQDVFSRIISHVCESLTVYEVLKAIPKSHAFFLVTLHRLCELPIYLDTYDPRTATASNQVLDYLLSSHQDEAGVAESIRHLVCLVEHDKYATRLKHADEDETEDKDEEEDLQEETRKAPLPTERRMLIRKRSHKRARGAPSPTARRMLISRHSTDGFPHYSAKCTSWNQSITTTHLAWGFLLTLWTLWRAVDGCELWQSMLLSQEGTHLGKRAGPIPTPGSTSNAAPCLVFAY